MEKDFISATPDTGGQGQTEVQVSAGANPTFQSKETTANFSANGQVLKSVKAVQNGIPFVTWLGLNCNAAQRSVFDVNDFHRNNPYGNAIVPFALGEMTAGVKTSPDNFVLSVLIGGLISWYDITKDDELIVRLKWADRLNNELSDYYVVPEPSSDDDNDWQNYYCSIPFNSANSDSNAAFLYVELGRGRGDTGIYPDTIFMAYRFALV